MDTTDIREILERESRRVRKGLRVIRCAQIAASVTILPITLYHLILNRHADIAPLVFSVAPIVLGLRYIGLRMLRHAGNRLASVTDVRAIGPLVEAVASSDPNTRKVAERALIQLLPRLQATDSTLLNDQQRHIVNAALRAYASIWNMGADSQYGHSEKLIVVLLEAMEQIGDPTSLPHVERLAKSPKHKEVQQAANACLPSLRERAEQERRHGMLLRPASAPDPAAQTLLRPVRAVEETDPRILLRPSMSAEDE